MPPIKYIDLNDGIRIVGSGVPSVWIHRSDFPSLANAQILEGNLNNLIQSQYEKWAPLSEYPSDDPVKNKPKPILLINERIEKVGGTDYLVAITMYVAIHIFSTNPLSYTVGCQNSRSGPIGGEWWL